MTRRNHPSGRYTTMTEAELARDRAAFERAVARQQEKDRERVAAQRASKPVHEHPCKDIEEGLGCEACSDYEQQVAESAGHPEACSYTMKATYQEAIDHFLSRTPECDGFGFTCERCGSTIPPERHQYDCPIAAQYADADESLMGYAL